MNLFNRKHLTVRRYHQTAVWTFTDEGLAESVAEIFVRSADGLYYVRERYRGEPPDPALLYLHAYQRGLHSPRPFHLEHTWDASAIYCVLAFSISCLRAWNLNALALLHQADPRIHLTPRDLCEIKSQAQWERAVPPGAWDGPAIRLLCSALEAVECASLARLIRLRILKAHGR
jgi:hypothetical protein